MKAQPLKEPASHRRSTRLTLSVPITLSGVDALQQPFQEQTHTILVNKHGAKVTTRHELAVNSTVHVHNSRLGRKAQARVVVIDKRRSPSDPFEVGIALEEPGNIWGVEFPPDDWKESPAATPAAAAPAPPPAVEPAMKASAAATPPQPPAPPKAAVSAPPSPATAAETQQALAEFKEQLKLTCKAFAGLFEDELAKLLQKTSQGFRTELQQFTADLNQATAAALRKQLQDELERFDKEIRVAQQKAVRESLEDIRRRLAALQAAFASAFDETTEPRK